MLDFSKVKVGSKLRVLKDGVWAAGVLAGDILTVETIDNSGSGDVSDLSISTEGMGWGFDDDTECVSGLELVE